MSDVSSGLTVLDVANGSTPLPYDGDDIGVAVIDSGVNTVDDLKDASGHSRIVYNESFIPKDDGTNDDYGHGTHVAGIIAGNGKHSTGGKYTYTVRGIAPGANIVNLRVLDDHGSGTDSAVIAAIQRAIQLKATCNIRVINLSLGRNIPSSYTSDPQCQAVQQTWSAGIVVVVAAGNGGRDNSHKRLPDSGCCILAGSQLDFDGGTMGQVKLQLVALIVLCGAVNGQVFRTIAECVGGKRVTTKDGRNGTVYGIDRAMYPLNCNVTMDSGEGIQSFIYWDLRPMGAAANPKADHVTLGSYSCVTFAGIVNHGGRVEVRPLWDVTVTSPSTYIGSDGKPGNFVFDAARGQVAFSSGAMKGNVAKYVPADGGKFVYSGENGEIDCGLDRNATETATPGPPPPAGTAARPGANAGQPPVTPGPPPGTAARPGAKAGQAVGQPELIQKSDPVYPSLARQASIEGTVRFAVTVGINGVVKNVQLVSGHPLLVPAANAAVQKYVYRPATQGGQPVESTIQVDVPFALGRN